MLAFRRYFQGDRRNVGVSVLLLFVMMCGHALLETARDTLFLTQLPGSELPWVYFSVAMVSIAIVAWQGRSPQLMRKRGLLTVSLILCAAVSFLFASAPQKGLFFYTFYVWVAVVATVCVGQFWLLMADRFFISQAKRVYTLIGAGGLVGASVGSLLSALLVKTLGAGVLIYGGTAFLTTAAFLSRFLSDRPETEHRSARPASVGKYADVFRHPFTRKIVFLIFFCTVTLTLVDISFRTAIVTHIPKDQLGTFFATLYTALNVTAFLIQWFAAGRLVQRLGTVKVLAILPVLLGLSLGSFGLTLAFLPLLFTKFVDGALRHSLHRTSLEILFVPIPSRIRAQTKTLGDTLGGRFGQGIASLLALGFFSFGLFPTPAIWMVVAFAGAWLGMVILLRKEYIELFRTQLREDLVLTTGEVRDLDQASVETLVAALSDRAEDRVTHAMEILASRQKSHLIPSFILYHPSPRVVMSALQILARTRRTDYWEATRHLVTSEHPEIQTLALALYARTAPQIDTEILKAATGAADLRVRASAFVALIQRQEVTLNESPKAAKWLISGSEEQRAAVLNAIREHHATQFDALLAEISANGGPLLGMELARLVSSRPDPKFISTLIPFLAYRRCRAEVRSALLSIGEPAYRALCSALEDTTLASTVRRHLPRTLSRFDHRESAGLLLRQLSVEKDPVVFFKILRGLGRLVTQDPALKLEPRILNGLLDSHTDRLQTLRHWSRTLEGTAGRSPTLSILSTTLVGLEKRLFEELFRLLGMRFPFEDFRQIHRSLLANDPRTRAGGQELLENVLPEPLRSSVLRAYRRSADWDTTTAIGDSLESVLGQMAGSEFSSLRELAREARNDLPGKAREHAV